MTHLHRFPGGAYLRAMAAAAITVLVCGFVPPAADQARATPRRSIC